MTIVVVETLTLCSHFALSTWMSHLWICYWNQVVKR